MTVGDLALSTPAVRSSAKAEREATFSRTPILLMTCLAIILGWLPRLAWGFWIDETATYWMASEGWRGAIERTWTWAGQSILYSMLESLFVVHGPWQEVLLRVPSVIAVLLAAWQVKRLAELLIGEDLGWYALVPFVCAPDAMSFATNARSYGLALTASLASMRYLIEWQREGGKKNAALYLVASILTVHLHYLFGFILVIQAAYLAFAAWGGTSVKWSLPAAVVAAVPFSMIPILGSLRSMAQQTVDFQAAQPLLKHWFQLVFPPSILLGLGLGAVLALLIVPYRKLHWNPVRLSRPIVFLLTFWLLVAPVLFFLVSRFTPSTMFASRYLLFTLPAFVVLVTWIISGIQNIQARTILTVAVFATNVLHPAMLLSAFRVSPMSWREPVRYLARQPKDIPVFAASGFAHATFMNWKAEDPRTSALFAPIGVYGLTNPVIPLPYQFYPEVQQFVEQQTAAMTQTRRVLLLGATDSGLVPWMTRHMQGLGFQAHSTDFNDFVVVDFSRP